MANARLPRHGHTHARGGPDEIPGLGIYVVDVLLDAPADHVLFDAFPDYLVRLELEWSAWLDSPTGSDSDDYVMGLLMNGDATTNTVGADEEEYHWNVGIPNNADPGLVSIDENTYFNDYGAVSWIGPTYRTSVGSIRFPDYQTGGDDFQTGRPWYGHGTVGDIGNADSNPFVCGGGKQDYRRDPLTALAAIATDLYDISSRQNFAAGSRFTLTGY